MRLERSDAWWSAAPAVVSLVLLVVADLVIRRSDVALSPLFAVAPLLACAVLPARPTALVAVAATGAAHAAGGWNDTWGTAQHAVRVADVALIGAAAVVIAAVRVRREQRFARVAAIAEVAQRTILPKVPPVVGDLVVGTRYLSAAEDTVVGGDLYDWHQSDGRVRFLVGDVRGKGVDAVEQAARVIRAFRQFAASEPSLERTAERMSAYVAPFFDDEEFVTALLVDTAETDRFTLVSCGHCPPLLVSDGTGTLVEVPAGLPLGLGDGYEAVTRSWQPGDRLLLYTDGLSEARDEHRCFLSVGDLGPVLSAGTVEDALDGVLASVTRHVPGGRLNDDLAVVLLQNGGASLGESDEETRGLPFRHVH
jgi:serine phosphatase RsbU (regulator of sigma subunit)